MISERNPARVLLASPPQGWCVNWLVVWASGSLQAGCGYQVTKATHLYTPHHPPPYCSKKLSTLTRAPFSELERTRDSSHFGLPRFAHFWICHWSNIKMPSRGVKQISNQCFMIHWWAYIVIQDNQALGIGSGSTIVFAVERIGELNLGPDLYVDTKGTCKSSCIINNLCVCI